ncbi:hypothetical protein [Flavobacterium silvaticum]|uniref:Uncharacterized protein n=1 Tax=Flavobacterium silvaticum TaxID=1852020 RepID=A0A972FVD5_9FLAO|nr:hypothetical protein [Flavobacterium silvaticum]NMH28310.1 hypothetical protein [Flavobacterium silvaticum]
MKDKTKALVLYSYSKRSYGNDVTPFLEKLKDSRNGLLNEMITAKVPEVKL